MQIPSFQQISSQCGRCLGCAKAACSNACPVHVNIPAVMKLVAEGNFAQATKVVGHPFGGVCGFVCPHELQCQGHCVLGKRGMALCGGEAERYAFMQSPYKVALCGSCLQGVSVAVVGGGVSGVTFAVKCREQGADVTIFEQNTLLGTLYSIPQFRLPHSLVDDVCRCVTDAGIKVNYTFVDEELCQNLQKHFTVVYFATGITKGRSLGCQGEELALPSDVFLRGDYHGKVVVVGGGNTAMDCARLNARLGGSSLLLYRRSEADMPAFSKEISAAKEDGVNFSCNALPVKVERQGSGLIVTCANTISQGRGSLQVGDERFTIECDAVVAAVGGEPTVMLGGQKRVAVEDGLAGGNVYAGGDVIGSSSVAEAVADALTAFSSVTQRFGR